MEIEMGKTCYYGNRNEKEPLFMEIEMRKNRYLWK